MTCIFMAGTIVRMTEDTNNVKVDLTDPWDRFQKETGRLQVIRTHEIWDGDMVADVLNFERDEKAWSRLIAPDSQVVTSGTPLWKRCVAWEKTDSLP